MKPLAPWRETWLSWLYLLSVLVNLCGLGVGMEGKLAVFARWRG